MKKKILLGLITLLVALSAASCGTKSKEESESAVVVSKDDITYKKIYEANKGSSLMDKYEGISFKLKSVTGEYDENGEEKMSTENWTLFKQDGEFVISRESDTGESIVYGEGTCYYEKVAEGEEAEYGYGWFMDGVYTNYISAKVDQFLVDRNSDEDIDEVTESGSDYIVKSYVGEDGDEKYYYMYTLDKSTLELKKFEAVIEKTVDGSVEKQVVSSSEVSYDVKGKMPEFVQTLKDVDKNRTITIHNVKDGKVTDDIEVKIPKNAKLLAALDDGYGLFLDENAESPYDDDLSELGSDGAYPDNECYLVYTGQMIQ